MNPRILAVSVLIAAVAACAYFLFWSGPSPVDPPDFNKVDSRQEVRTGNTQPDRPAKKEPSNGTPTGSVETKPAVNWKRFAAMAGLPGAPGEEMPKITADTITRFLAKHGETPVNLVTAFEKTRDHTLLDRALSRFPGSPIVLMAAIDAAPQDTAKPGEKYEPDPERLALIDRFKAADPRNPLAWIYSAQELFKAGNAAEAIADIRAALDRPAFYTWSTERIDAAQRLYEDIGLHPLEASLLSMAHLPLPHLSAATQSSRMLMERQKSAAESGDPAASDEALRLTYGLGRTFGTPEASRTLIGQLVGSSMESRALKALPADSQPEWLNVNPTQRLAEIDRQKQNVKEVVAGLESVIRSQNDEILSEYIRRMRTESEAAAFEWLKTKKQ